MEAAASADCAHTRFSGTEAGTKNHLNACLEKIFKELPMQPISTTGIWYWKVDSRTI
jgi:hypothetical protein